ncbi:rbcL [Symbiodinium sp. CCMP2592]|nr:rbcL [Symbiodinium sp. CCMP2592]
MNAAGNAINHPETMQPHPIMPGSPLTPSSYACDTHGCIGTPPAAQGTAMHGRKFEGSFQKDVYADQEFCNDVGYLPEGTRQNRAGNAINHPENIGQDSNAPGSPLPCAIFVSSVDYLPGGTPLNRVGNTINHPETIGPDLHVPGSPLPPSVYAADVGNLVDGTPLETAGTNSVPGTAEEEQDLWQSLRAILRGICGCCRYLPSPAPEEE